MLSGVENLLGAPGSRVDTVDAPPEVKEDDAVQRRRTPQARLDGRFAAPRVKLSGESHAAPHASIEISEIKALGRSVELFLLLRDRDALLEYYMLDVAADHEEDDSDHDHEDDVTEDQVKSNPGNVSTSKPG